jgi:hypothetical protein
MTSKSNRQSVPHHEIVVLPQHGHKGREELLEQCFNLRINVFHHEQNFPLETERDGFVIVHFLYGVGV